MGAACPCSHVLHCMDGYFDNQTVHITSPDRGMKLYVWMHHGFKGYRTTRCCLPDGCPRAEVGEYFLPARCRTNAREHRADR